MRSIKERLASLFKSSDHGVLVGSTEEFQGQERDVMIISTVRSSQGEEKSEVKGAGLGFLTNCKRFNVAITRARTLMIVIGDPVLLQRDENWKELLKHAVDNG